MSVPVVALIGRPNVGKSALFNRIIGEDEAIVSDEAGTTRDRHFSQGGVEWPRLLARGHRRPVRRSESRRWIAEIRRQVATAIEEADMILFVVDANDRRAPERLRASPRCCARRASRCCSWRTRSTIRAARLLRVLPARCGRSVSGVGAERQELRRPARRDRRAAPRERFPKTRRRCASPSSAGRTSASRRSSTGCSARTASS